MAQGNLLGTVVDEKDAPLSGATVTLIGTPTPQAQVTDAQGKFRFDNLAPGTYELSAVLKGRRTAQQSDIAITNDQDTETKITMTAEESAALAAQPLSLLSILNSASFQNIALTVIGGVVAYSLFKGLTDISAKELSEDKLARGVVTYVVTVGTMAIAMILALSAILGNEASLIKRFTLGKEILAILIGVQGTIIGFYYGSTVKANAPSDNTAISQPSAIQVTGIKFTSEPSKGTTPTLEATITGGEPEYIYSVKFDKDVTEPITNQTSADGKINRAITFKADAAAGEVGFTIEGKDKKGADFKSPRQKVTLK